MSRPSWTVLGVIAVVLVAGLLISVLFHLFWLVARLAIIAAAVAVLFALRSLVARRGGRRSPKS